MKNYLVKILAKNPKDIDRISSKPKAKKVSGIRGDNVAGYRATVILPEKEIGKLDQSKKVCVESYDKKSFNAEKELSLIKKKITVRRKAKVNAEVIGDFDKLRKIKQNLVSKDNRFLNQKKNNNSKYYNVEEIEFALGKCQNHFIKRFILPEQTHETNYTSYVKISTNTNSKKTGVYFIGGVHGDEWTPPDALVFFIEKLSDAYQNKKDIVLGNYQCNFESVKQIIDNLNIYVFPQVNYDGRKSSQTSENHTVRKNRRPEADPNNIGVDINRNYDALWNFEDYFANGYTNNMSKDKSHRNYIGPNPFSEPETRNVKYVFDTNPDIRFFVDIHSDGEVIFYNWSNAMFQSNDDTMNFKNRNFWKKHGDRYGEYWEYIDEYDTALRISLAKKMTKGIASVNGVRYKIQPSIDYSPVSGSSTDYFDSLPYIDNTKPKVHGFTLECAKEHVPGLKARENVIMEVTAALLELCRFAAFAKQSQ